MVATWPLSSRRLNGVVMKDKQEAAAAAAAIRHKTMALRIKRNVDDDRLEAGATGHDSRILRLQCNTVGPPWSPVCSCVLLLARRRLALCAT